MQVINTRSALSGESSYESWIGESTAYQFLRLKSNASLERNIAGRQRHMAAYLTAILSDNGELHDLGESICMSGILVSAAISARYHVYKFQQARCFRQIVVPRL